MNETAAAVTSASAPAAMGFAHFIAQSDAVGRVLMVILLLMSILSWTLILSKGVRMLLRQRQSTRFLARFWNAQSLDSVHQDIQQAGVKEPFANLTVHAMHARNHHVRLESARLAEAGTQQEFLARTIKKVLDEETTRMENGLSILATIGATAPFVGLFGTVWGIYHALIAIGMSGAGTLDKVAGPVGEALIMTAVGLAVAIPAVMGYNWLARSNRVLGARLDAFAFELHTFLSTGSSLRGSAARKPSAHQASSSKKSVA